MQNSLPLRGHTADFPRLSGEPWANQETLSKVATFDTVIVSSRATNIPKRSSFYWRRSLESSSHPAWHLEIQLVNSNAVDFALHRYPLQHPKIGLAFSQNHAKYIARFFSEAGVN